MTDKPLEWVVPCEVTLYPNGSTQYVVYKDHAVYVPPKGITINIPGPYDGTIETAKQRCEEHRRKMSK